MVSATSPTVRPSSFAAVVISFARAGATASADKGSFAVERKRVSNTPCWAAVKTSSKVLAPYSTAPPARAWINRRASAQIDDLDFQAFLFEESAGLRHHIQWGAQQLTTEADTGGLCRRHHVIRLRMMTPSSVGYPIDPDCLFTFGSMGHRLSTMTALGKSDPIDVIGNSRLWMGSTLEAERRHALAPKHRAGSQASSSSAGDTPTSPCRSQMARLRAPTSCALDRKTSGPAR